MKDVGLGNRVQRALRERFLDACQAQDKPAAQAPREFMGKYVAEHRPKIGQSQASQRLQLRGIAAVGRVHSELAKP